MPSITSPSVPGEVKDRKKVMGGLKKPDTTLLRGYQIYHIYLRAHEGLDGKTPSEACGIKVEGSDKWITIIQNASRAQKIDTWIDVQ